MKKTLSALAVTLILFAIFLPTTVKADIIFADSFFEGYNELAWHTPAESTSPVPSSFGITGLNSNIWSVIEYLTNWNNVYEIQFDIKVNNNNSLHTWGIGIGDNANHWKILNTWQSSLQLHDSNGQDKLIPWDHSIGIHHFKIRISPQGNTLITVIEGEQQLPTLLTTADFTITKVWVSFLGNGDYEMANFVLSTYDPPTPTNTPTPTPSNTPTPTLAPTLTPTPTPTAEPTPPLPKKVVVLHGAGGSWNKDALMNCKTDNYSGAWSPWRISNFDIYQPLINAIDAAGFTSDPYYYDWRQVATNTSGKLNSYISSKLASDETFDIVGHSFGGLVARAYLESTQENSRVDKLLTVGSPHQGSVFAYPAWSGGEMWLDDPAMRLGYTIMKIGCLRRGMTAREMITKTMPSVQNILPTFDYLKDTKGNLKPLSAMTAKNNWLPTSFASPYFNTTIETITGSGYSTLNTLEIKDAGKLDKRLGNWLDGKPTNDKTYSDGDGTVLAQSAQLPGALNTILPLDHAALMYDPSGIAAIIRFLHEQPPPQPLRVNNQLELEHKAPRKTAALMVIVDGASATLTDNKGNITKDSEGQITILDPSPKAYTLTVAPEHKWWWKSKYKLIIVQLFDDGSYKWKEYDRYNLTKKRFKIRFDRTDKHDDILQDH